MQTPTGTLILLGAALLAGPALAQSASVNASGATVAAETARHPDRATGVIDGETPADETAPDVSTRVRAPAVTYSYESSNRDHIDQDAQVTRRDTSSQGSDGGSDDRPIFDRWGRQGAPQDGSERHVEGSTRGETRTSDAAPVNGIGGTGGGRYTFVPATRSGATDSTDGGPRTGEPDLRSTGTASGFAPVRPAEFLARDQEARGTDDESQPGILRVINNSEVDTATVEGGVTARPVTLTPDRPR